MSLTDGFVKRHSPSGPKFGEDLNAGMFAQSVPYSFSVDAPGQATVESSRIIYPVPPFGTIAGTSRYGVFANPHHYQPETLPAWLDDWGMSHVRIGDFDIDMHALEPGIAAGTLGVEVIIGMSSLKAILSTEEIIDALFDINFQLDRNELSVFPIPVPPPGPS